MSKSTTPTDSNASLTEDEQSLFERLADHGDDEVTRICELVLQSSESREATN